MFITFTIQFRSTYAVSASASQQQQESVLDTAAFPDALRNVSVVVHIQHGSKDETWLRTQRGQPGTLFSKLLPPVPPCEVRCLVTASNHAEPADLLIVNQHVWMYTNWRYNFSLLPALSRRWPGVPTLYWSYEPSDYFPLDGPELRSYFDSQMSFRRAAALRISFACRADDGVGNEISFARLEAEKAAAPAAIERIVAAKSWRGAGPDERLAAFYASNCAGGGAGRRTAYVAELMRHMRVDSYGKCLRNTKDSHGPVRHVNAIQALFAYRIRQGRSYKFVLAFENTDAEPDYVSEKVWLALLSEAVPVYWGDAAAARAAVPPGSVIYAADFASPAALARHLRRIANSPALYRRYHQWRREPLGYEGTRIAVSRCVEESACRACKYAALMRAPGTATPRAPPEDRAVVLGPGESLGVLLRRDMMAEALTFALWARLDAAAGGVPGRWTAPLLNIGAATVSLLSEQTASLAPRLQLCVGPEERLVCRLGRRRLPRGVWVHVAAAVSKSGTVTLLLNGVDEAQLTMHWPEPLPGIYVGGEGLHGAVDEVVMLRGALTGAEARRTLMFVYAPADPRTIVAATLDTEADARRWWRCDGCGRAAPTLVAGGPRALAELQPELFPLA